MTHFANRICSLLIILSLLILLGCASKPTVIGKWKAIEVPEDYKNRGVETITIDILQDNSFSVSMFSADDVLVDGFGGAWTPLEENIIEFEMLEPPYNRGTGELLPDDRLRTIGGGYTIYNQRVTE